MGVNLVKGQKISLDKSGGLKKIFMGLGWDMAEAPRKSGGGSFLGKLFGGGGEAPKSIDLDASCVICAGGQCVDVVYFGKLRSNDGSVVHTGDNLTGEGDGDDEVIRVNLEHVPANVDALVFTVSSYSGQNFSEIANAFCRIVDEGNGKELARYDISGGGQHTGLIMAKLYRHKGEWKLAAIGEPMMSRTARDLIEPIRAIL